RDRHHEHHADERDRAYPGDRDPQVARRHTARHPPPVPRRIRHPGAAGRRARAARRRGARRPRRGRLAAARPRHPVVGRRRPGPRRRRGNRVRRLPRDASGAARSRGSAALRMKLHSVSEGWLIALDQLRANKLRSGLTILGVVIGVATVMAMASIVQGIRDQIMNTIEVAGPTTFYIMRFFSSTPLNPDALPKQVRIRPVVKPEEATALARLPEIRYAGTWVQLLM